MSGPICPQDRSITLDELLYNINVSYIETLEMDEGCLLLNVYTPNLEGLRPVMVFIHGGGFTTGLSSKLFCSLN